MLLIILVMLLMVLDLPWRAWTCPGWPWNDNNGGTFVFFNTVRWTWKKVGGKSAKGCPESVPSGPGGDSGGSGKSLFTCHLVGAAQ